MNLAAIKSLQWVDFFLFSITDPGALYRQISRNEPKPFALSFAVPVIVVLLDIIASSLIVRETTFFYSKLSYGWLISIFFTLFRITVAVALMDAIAQVLGYRGNIREMMTLVNFSLFPRIFLLPALFIFKVLHFAAPFFYVFIQFLLFLWSAFIVIKGISEMHDSGFGHALIIFLFPYILVGVTGVCLLILGVLYFVQFIGG